MSDFKVQNWDYISGTIRSWHFECIMINNIIDVWYHRLRTHDSQIVFGQYHIQDTVLWLCLKIKNFCRKNNWMMKIMDKGIKVPKLVLIRYSFGWSAQLIGQKSLGYLWKKASSGVRSLCKVSKPVSWAEINFYKLKLMIKADMAKKGLKF